MQIFYKELKLNRRTLAIWALALALLNILIMSVYPAFAQDTEKMDEFMAIVPEAWQRAFGLGKVSLADPLGFYAVEAYFMILLFGNIFAVILGAGILAKEEDDKTIEFLLARPVTRTRVLTEKILAWLSLLAVFNLVISLLTLGAFYIFVDTPWSLSHLLKLLAAPFLAQVVFASIGFLSALFFSRRRTSMSFSIGIVLGFYFMSVAAALSEKLNWIRWLTPFYYVDGTEIVVNNSIGLPYLAIMGGVIALCLTLTYYFYNKRDITI